MILVSACLTGIFCRWDGGSNLVPELRALYESGEAVIACPEVLGGLHTPRLPSEKRGECVFNRREEDVTDEFRKGAEAALRICLANGCESAVLKSKSPSCGKGVIHNGKFDGGLVAGNGIAAQLLIDHGIAVMTEQEWLEQQAGSHARQA